MNNIFLHYKNKFLFLLLFLFAFGAKNADAQVITTLPLANLSLCACTQITVSYSATGVYNAGNIFTVQLSDAFGNFVGATPIGTLASQALNGNIICTIPCNTPYGTAYRMRVISSAPVAGGPNNGSNITIKPSPTVSINFSTATCVDTLTAIPAGGGVGVVPGNKYYITDVVPWFVPNNVNEMDAVFGVGGWIAANFSTPAAGIYVPGTQFVFIEGGDQNGVGCTNYINANIALIENWVNAGGRLFLNAAPNNGGIQNWGFGGVVLNYMNYITPSTITLPLHPIALGPNLPILPNYTGNYFAHANVINGGTTVIHNTNNAADAILTEKAWGAGIAMFGGMTTTNWHTPFAEAVNLRKNIFEYLAGNVMVPPTYTYLWSNGDTTQKILPGATGVYTVTVTSNQGCTATATYNYVAPPAPVVNILATGTLCSGNTVTLDAGAGFTTYLWDDATALQTRVVAAAGTYYVTVTNAQGCIGSDTIVVNQDSSVVADFTAVLHLGCVNDTVFLTNNSTGGTQFNWLYGDGGYSTFQNPVPYIYFNQGNWTIRLIVSNPPCADTMYVPISINHHVASDFNTTTNTTPPNDDSTCLGNAFLVNLIPPADPTWTHLWNWGNGNIVNTVPPYAYVYPSPGSYTLWHYTTDTLGCVDSSYINLFVDYQPFATFTATDSNICVGDKITFYDTMSPNIYNFYWDFNDGSILNNAHHPTHTWDNPGTYAISLTAQSLFCNSVLATKNIQVNGYPNINLGKDTSICPGVTGSILITDVNNPATVYDWNTGESASSIVVSNPGTYWARSGGECSTTDSITIRRDCYLNIPNAFSPDGDGLNDYFLPRELLSAGLKSFKMNIYNRWGENIFTTTSIDGRGWDGKYNGVPQPMSTYVYIIDAEFDNNLIKNFKGNVILVR